jgi:hypothetical protein
MIKNILLSTIIIASIHICKAQSTKANQNISITSLNSPTKVRTDDKGQFLVNVSPSETKKFKATGIVSYTDFGAKGDGKTDDIDAIAATHAFANQHQLKVEANDQATYYISGRQRPAYVQTHTDFGKATFIIDDTDVENRQESVFIVASDHQPIKLKDTNTLKRNQAKIDISLSQTSLITVTNTNVKQYIRLGLNQNNGASQTDIFVVDKNGNVDPNTPIIWDFDQITEMTALPMDEKPLYITGGRFITLANVEQSTYGYYSRNIAIKRSNVVVDSLEHRIQGEGDQGAPYGGFLFIRDCANVTVKNTLLTGHQTYGKIGSAGKPVSMGSYDIQANRALNVSFVNCTQTNDINDRKYWGIMASNFSKNILYDRCTLSRFDAHMGVANATIRNSILGHMGINAIGSGIFTLENTTVQGRAFINLRQDYGSTWQGEFIIRNSTFAPIGDSLKNVSLIGGYNTGQHDFGYTCYMPKRIRIENLRIEDAKIIDEGVTIFTNFNEELTSDSYFEKYPYVRTKEVFLRNITTASGKKLRVSENMVMFGGVRVE